MTDLNDEDIRKVWRTSRDQTGFSKSKIARMTGIGVEVVERILHRLLDWGLISQKRRQGFTGWVSEGNNYDLEDRLEDEAKESE